MLDIEKMETGVRLARQKVAPHLARAEGIDVFRHLFSAASRDEADRIDAEAEEIAADARGGHNAERRAEYIALREMADAHRLHVEMKEGGGFNDENRNKLCAAPKAPEGSDEAFDWILDAGNAARRLNGWIRQEHGLPPAHEEMQTIYQGFFCGNSRKATEVHRAHKLVEHRDAGMVRLAGVLVGHTKRLYEQWRDEGDTTAIDRAEEMEPAMQTLAKLISEWDDEAGLPAAISTYGGSAIRETDRPTIERLAMGLRATGAVERAAEIEVVLAVPENPNRGFLRHIGFQLWLWMQWTGIELGHDISEVFSGFEHPEYARRMGWRAIWDPRSHKLRRKY